jgi:hypothetical protein
MHNDALQIVRVYKPDALAGDAGIKVKPFGCCATLSPLAVVGGYPNPPTSYASTINSMRSELSLRTLPAAIEKTDRSPSLRFGINGRPTGVPFASVATTRWHHGRTGRFAGRSGRQFGSVADFGLGGNAGLVLVPRSSSSAMTSALSSFSSGGT